MADFEEIIQRASNILADHCEAFILVAANKGHVMSISFNDEPGAAALLAMACEKNPSVRKMVGFAGSLHTLNNNFNNN